jgi:hypothetical protein
MWLIQMSANGTGAVLCNNSAVTASVAGVK